MAAFIAERKLSWYSFFMQAVYIWYWVLGILFVKCYLTSAIQGIVRLRSRSFRHQDDAKFFGGGRGVSGVLAPIDEVATHVWRNDLENIPFFLLLLLGHALITVDAKGTLWLGVAFVSSRVLHTFFFFFPRQPWRNIAYQGGIITSFITLVKTLAHGLS